jgi:hypothetical protein
MKILFLHGWQSVPGGVKPTFLAQHGHIVINPKLPDDDFDEAVKIAQAEFDRHQPEVVIGSSRGGAVAMNISSGDGRLVLLCPAWKKFGMARTVKPGTVILHSRADDVIPFADSEELVRNSGLPTAALTEVGNDHRLADPEPLKACESKANLATSLCSDHLYTNRTKCKASEIGDLRSYLLSTPVPWLCELIDAGACVYKAEVHSAAQIGDLETIFGCLGGIKSQESLGKRRFLVKHVMDTLRNPACTDAKMLQTIIDYQQRLGESSFEIKITLLECADGIILCDGNKRTVAILERAKAEKKELVLPVYIVSDPRMQTS